MNKITELLNQFDISEYNIQFLDKEEDKKKYLDILEKIFIEFEKVQKIVYEKVKTHLLNKYKKEIQENVKDNFYGATTEIDCTNDIADFFGQDEQFVCEVFDYRFITLADFMVHWARMNEIKDLFVIKTLLKNKKIF